MNKNWLYAGIATLVVALGIGAYVFWSAPKKGVQAQRPIIVGTNVGYPPFIMTDDDGAVTGFDVSVMRAIGDKLGRVISFKDMSFDALLIALQQGQVDAVIGGVSITPERSDKIKLIQYYGQETPDAALFFLQKNPLEIETLDDLKNSTQPITICTQAGNIFEVMLNEYQNVTVKTFSEISELFLEVSYEKSDACLLDIDSVTALVAKGDNLAMKVVGLPESYASTGFGIGVRKDNKPLASAIRNTVTQLRNDGTLARLRLQWFGGSDNV